jgi:hypothetical protein
VRTCIRTAKPLALLILLAVVLTWLVAGRGGATAAFQSPNPFESELLTPTAEPSAFPTATEVPLPTPSQQPTMEPTLEPTIEPTLEAPSEPTMSPTPSGFLPPPTLTSPGTPVPAGAPSLMPEELPARVAPTEPPSPVETNSLSQPNLTATLASLIDQAVLAIGYLGLCCGVLALVGVGSALVWFVRRSRRG